MESSLSVRVCHDQLLDTVPSCVSLSGYELTGLARGGEQLSRLKRNYARAVELLVELASLQVEGAVANIESYCLSFFHFCNIVKFQLHFKKTKTHVHICVCRHLLSLWMKP